MKLKKRIKMAGIDRQVSFLVWTERVSPPPKKKCKGGGHPIPKGTRKKEKLGKKLRPKPGF